MPRFIKYVGCGTNKLIHDFIIHDLYFPSDVYTTYLFNYSISIIAGYDRAGWKNASTRSAKLAKPVFRSSRKSERPSRIKDSPCRLLSQACEI